MQEGEYLLLCDTLLQRHVCFLILGIRDQVMSMQRDNSGLLSMLFENMSQPFHVLISNCSNSLHVSYGGAGWSDRRYNKFQL